jgi:hypothetical protein
MHPTKRVHIHLGQLKRVVLCYIEFNEKSDILTLCPDRKTALLYQMVNLANEG